ncbi:MAG TPA: nucleotidyltransferase family protein [Polyangia bacterium]|nr:nucleotidyltransferase family protein [Polyangia bacterium]
MAGGDDGRIRRLLFDTVAVSVLEKVLEAARAAGAAPAPVKGVVLARWLYDDVADRPYRDLDLLAARDDLPRLEDAVAARGWPVQVCSREMGELEFTVDRLTVEVHAEFGRRDLSRLTIADVLARGTLDGRTFPFEVRRIDDIDHLLLLVANVTKKSFTYANAHQPADLARLLERLRPRWDELAARARAARFTTALRLVSAWMAEERGSPAFAAFARLLPGPGRRLVPAAIAWQRRRDRRAPRRLESAAGLLGLALATQTPDDLRLRVRGLARLVRRGLARRLGRDPG